MDWRLLLGERLLQATPLKKIARLVCNKGTPAQLAPAGKESPPAETEKNRDTQRKGFPSVASPGKGVSGSWQASTPAQKDRKVTHTTGSSDPMVGSSRSFRAQALERFAIISMLPDFAADSRPGAWLRARHALVLVQQQTWSAQLRQEQFAQRECPRANYHGGRVLSASTQGRPLQAAMFFVEATWQQQKQNHATIALDPLCASSFRGTMSHILAARPGSLSSRMQRSTRFQTSCWVTAKHGS